jgi:5-methylcytosine-specific restriction endonuclease McrA
MTRHSLRHVSDDLLSFGLDASASDDRLANATLLAHIAEFDRRRLFLPTKYPSMFRYCVGHLRMSEDIALKRVRVARVARRFPVVFDAIADGRLNLSGVMLLARCMTRANGSELLEAAMNRSRAEIQELLARRFPLVGPPANCVTASPGAEGPTSARPAADPLAGAAEAPDEKAAPNAQAPGPVEIAGVFRGPGPNSLPELQVRVRPVAPGRYELVAIIDQETHDRLEASRELLGHAVPSRALIEVLERAIALQHAHLRKRRCGAADRPRTGAHGSEAPPRHSANPRHVPDAVRRAVWERDGGHCAFTSVDGHRCEERSRIELDHVVPVARGGSSTLENLRLLCRAHNQLAAEREFGKERMQERREEARRRRAAELVHRQAERERTEKRKAEITRQREELGEALRQLGYRGRSLEIALAYCASRAEAPLEERLKYALGCMAPLARREGPAPHAAA